MSEAEHEFKVEHAEHEFKGNRENCRIEQLRNKEVINIDDATRLGCVYDVEVDSACGKVVNIVVVEGGFFFFRRPNEYIICWEEIVKIGPCIILVSHDCRRDLERFDFFKKKKKRRHF